MFGAVITRHIMHVGTLFSVRNAEAIVSHYIYTMYSVYLANIAAVYKSSTECKTLGVSQNLSNA